MVALLLPCLPAPGSSQARRKTSGQRSAAVSKRRPLIATAAAASADYAAALTRYFGAAADEARNDRARNGSRPGHPLHPLFVAKNESSDSWIAEAKNATASAAQGRKSSLGASNYSHRRPAKTPAKPPKICHPSFYRWEKFGFSSRATGITAYLKNGGTLEKAAAMANHASTRTTQLYDRRRDEVSLDEAKRIAI
jgi:hypothetical protein